MNKQIKKILDEHITHQMKPLLSQLAQQHRKLVEMELITSLHDLLRQAKKYRKLKILVRRYEKAESQFIELTKNRVGG